MWARHVGETWRRPVWTSISKTSPPGPANSFVVSHDTVAYHDCYYCHCYHHRHYYHFHHYHYHCCKAVPCKAAMHTSAHMPMCISKHMSTHTSKKVSVSVCSIHGHTSVSSPTTLSPIIIIVTIFSIIIIVVIIIIIIIMIIIIVVIVVA